MIKLPMDYAEPSFPRWFEEYILGRINRLQQQEADAGSMSAGAIFELRNLFGAYYPGKSEEWLSNFILDRITNLQQTASTEAEYFALQELQRLSSDFKRRQREIERREAGIVY